MGADLVEKMAVMGDDDDSVLKSRQEIFEPDNGFSIQRRRLRTSLRLCDV